MSAHVSLSVLVYFIFCLRYGYLICVSVFSDKGVCVFRRLKSLIRRRDVNREFRVLIGDGCLCAWDNSAANVGFYFLMVGIRSEV